MNWLALGLKALTFFNSIMAYFTGNAEAKAQKAQDQAQAARKDLQNVEYADQARSDARVLDGLANGLGVRKPRAGDRPGE